MRARPEKAWRRRLHRRVLVNLTTGTALDGVLWRHEGRILVLRQATALRPGAQPLTLDGEVLVNLDDVDYAQVIPPAPPAPARHLEATA